MLCRNENGKEREGKGKGKEKKRKKERKKIVNYRIETCRRKLIRTLMNQVGAETFVT
jgi:hypothetical protein